MAHYSLITGRLPYRNPVAWCTAPPTWKRCFGTLFSSATTPCWKAASKSRCIWQAHWCVAGPRRRRLDDYGYWYAPDGRDAAAQAEFLRVEVRPQALEALFCAACNHPFRVSLDNLDGDPGDEARFAADVQALAERLHRDGPPPRARLWLDALRRYYRT